MSRSASQPPGRPFAAFDLDGTLIRWQLFHAIAGKLAEIDPGLLQDIETARMQWKRRSGEEAFREYELRLIEIYEELLRSISVQQFERAADEVFEEYKDQVYRYTRDLIKRLKAEGYLLFAISGSQSEIVSKIADYYGFDDYVGADYERSGDRFTGKITLHIGKKHLVLRQLIDRHGADSTGSYAVGDSAGDTSMLAMADNPIAFNPEKKLFEIAKQHGWPVVIERKNMVYRLNWQDGCYQLD